VGSGINEKMMPHSALGLTLKSYSASSGEENALSEAFTVAGEVEEKLGFYQASFVRF
jgi:hypothetical protein